MLDHFLQSAAQEEAVSFRQELACLAFSEEPAVLLEHLPEGLIEDQI